MLFFCYGVAHCTRSNLSDKERAGVALHFLHNDFGGREIWERNNTTKPMLRGPLATGGETEFGEKFEGRWEEIMNDVLASKAF